MAQREITAIPISWLTGDSAWKNIIQFHAERYTVLNTELFRDVIQTYLLHLEEHWRLFSEKNIKFARISSTDDVYDQTKVTEGNLTSINNLRIRFEVFGSFTRLLLGFIDDVPPGDIDIRMTGPKLSGGIVESFVKFLNSERKIYPQYVMSEQDPDKMDICEYPMFSTSYLGDTVPNGTTIQIVPASSNMRFDFGCNCLSMGVNGKVKSICPRFTVDEIIDQIKQRRAVCLSDQVPRHRSVKVVKKGFNISRSVHENN